MIDMRELLRLLACCGGGGALGVAFLMALWWALGCPGVVW